MSVQIEASENENFSDAIFQCWMPPNGLPPKGLLCVILHPINYKAGILANPVSWQSFAADANFALLTCSFSGKADPRRSWGRAMEGTGRALIEAIGRFSEIESLPIMNSLPIIAAGVCEAGQYAFELCRYTPERVVAFVTVGGGKHNRNVIENAAMIPGLFVASQDRGTSTPENITDVFKVGRKYHSPWGLAYEDVSTYDRGECGEAVVQFLHSALQFAARNPSAPRMRFSDGKCVSLPRSISEHKNSPENLSWMPHPIDSDLNVSADKVQLSFKHEAIAATGSILPHSISFQNLCFGDTPHFELEVTCNRNDIIDILMGRSPIVHVRKIARPSLSTWRITGELDLHSSPAGAFRVELPIRFIDKNEPVLGGESAVISGSVYGDVVPSPKALACLKERNNRTQSFRADVALTSRGAHRVRVIAVASEDNAKIRIVKTVPGNGTNHLQLEIEPIEVGETGTFSGYIVLTIESSERRQLRLLYYGKADQGHSGNAVIDENVSSANALSMHRAITHCAK